MIILSAIERHDGAEFTLTTEPLPVSSSTPSIGIFMRAGQRYVGKSQIAENIEGTLRAALKEICWNGIYAAYGCHAQRLMLSEQAWVEPAGAESFRDLYGVNFSRAIHVMSEWIEGFAPFNAGLIEQLRQPMPPEELMLTVDARVLPVQGVGQILAVALLVNDRDCLHARGVNVGYTVLKNEGNVPVALQAIKIDPGEAFYLLGRAVAHPDVLRDLENIRQGLIAVGSNAYVSFAGLPHTVKQEFLTTMRTIINTSPEQLRALFTREGLQPLFPDAAAIAPAVAFLQQRQAVLAQTYQALLDDAHQHPQTPEACLALIQAKYTQEATLRDPVTGNRYSIDAQFVNLSLLMRRDEVARAEAATIDNAGTREGLVSSFEVIRARKQPVALSDLFATDTHTRRINLVGGAGTGKSSTCQFIVSQWAQGNFLMEFSLVVWVPLRHLTSDRYPSGDSYGPLDLIIQEALGLPASGELSVQVAALYNPATTLWILDGYDEIVGRVPAHLRDVFDHMTTAPNRLLTGRPHAMQGFPCNAEVEVAGFSSDNIAEFVKRFVGSADHLPLLQHIKQNSLLRDLARVPINLILLCHALSAPGALEVAAESMSLTLLYQRVEQLMWQRYCQRQGEDMERLTPERQLTLTAPLMAAFSGIAFDAMRAGKIMIPGQRIYYGALAEGLEDSPTLWKKLLDSGVIVQAQGDSGDPLTSEFHFLHLTLQEYFAAKQIAAACQSNQAETLGWMRQNKYTQRLEVMWWFTAGLVTPIPEALERFGQIWLGAPRDLGGQWEARVWLRMVEEGRWHQLPTPTATIVEMLESLKQAVIHNVTRFLSGTKPWEDLPWCHIIFRDCPLWKRAVLLDNPAFMSVLQLALQSEDTLIKQKATGFLQLLGLPEILKLPWMASAFKSALQDSNAELRATALWVFEGMGDKLLTSPWALNRVLLALENKDYARVPDRLESMSRMFGMTPPQDFASQCVQNCAVGIVQRLGVKILTCPKLVTWLESAVQHTDLRIRESAARVLQGMGVKIVEYPWMVEWLKIGLQDHVPVSMIRDYAVHAARSLGPKLLECSPLVDVLAAMLTNNNPWVDFVQASAAQVLQGLGAHILENPALMSALRVALQKTSSRDVQKAGFQVLQGLGDALVVDPQWADLLAALRLALVGRDDYLQGCAVEVLAGFSERVLNSADPWVLQALHAALVNEKTQYRALSVMQQWGPRILRYPEMVEGLISALNSAQEHVSGAALGVLKNLGLKILDDSRMLAALQRALSADSIRVRHEALLVLPELGLQVLNHPPLLASLQLALQHEHEHIRKPALALLMSVLAALPGSGVQLPDYFFDQTTMMLAARLGAISVEGNMFYLDGKAGRFTQELSVAQVAQLQVVWFEVAPAASALEASAFSAPLSIFAAGGGGALRLPGPSPS